MELKRIILTVIVILVIFLIINALTSKSNTLSSMQDGNVSKIIPASELSSSTNLIFIEFYGMIERNVICKRIER